MNLSETCIEPSPSLPALGLLPPKRQVSELEIVCEGNSSHAHDFAEAPWDSSKHGSSFIPDEITKENPFTMATYKYLFRCGCGREGIQCVRALL